MRIKFFSILQNFLIAILGILIFYACNQVELKTKLELTAQTPQWSQLYVDIADLNQEIQNVKAQIKINQYEINHKFLLMDSTQSENVSVYRNKYFYYLSTFSKILKKSQKLHDKYVKDRTLYNYWLNTVQNDVISEEKALEEQKIFEKKYQNLRKEYMELRKEFIAFVQTSNSLADELSDVIPDLVGIKFKVRS